MQYSEAGDHKWDYSIPHDTTVPGIKGGIPHQVWEAEIDHRTGLPKRGDDMNYLVKKTGGIDATMIDIIKAVMSQDIFMMHVVDGIEAINIDHQGINLGEKVPEGMVFASLDPVAADNLCARYMFSNVPLHEALEVALDGGTDGGFPQKVPLPALEDGQIVTKMGYDCPLARNKCFASSEKRGLGTREYYVTGFDSVTGSQLVSLQGHLGCIADAGFSDLITETLYYDTFKVPWDLQRTTFSYLKAVDELEGTSLHKQLIKDFDENGDGILSYDEFGKKGIFGLYLHAAGKMLSMVGTEEHGYLKGRFEAFAKLFKYSSQDYNADGHDASKEFMMSSACSAAYRISRLEMDIPDPFVPGLICGNGNWPSYQLARFFQTGVMLYGDGYPNAVSIPSLYTSALFYADLVQNDGKYAGKSRTQPDQEAPNRYMADISAGKIRPLDFTMYVPPGYDDLSGASIPNTEATEDPSMVFTVRFSGGKEVWPDI
jgi:hypothetical protein